MKVSCNEVEIVIEYKNGDQQRYSKPAFAPSVKVEEIADGQTKMVSLTAFPSLDAVKTHFQKFIPTFN